MWILTISGIDQDESKLVWLQPNRTYKLGRAESSDIRLDRKYISSKHFELKVGESLDIANSSFTPLTVILESKGTTYIDNIKYKLNSATDPVRPRKFEVSKDNISFKFHKGDEIISITVNWIPITISYNASGQRSARDTETTIDQLLTRAASEFDLRLSEGVRSTTDYYLDTPVHNIAGLTYSLLHLLPVINENLLWKLLDDKEAIKADFRKFPDLSDYVPDPDFKIDERRKSMFEGITFFTTDKASAQYYKPVIEDAKGTLKFLSGSSVDAWVRSVTKVNKAVIIQFLSFEKLKSLHADSDFDLNELEELCAKVDKNLCRGDDLLQAVIKVDTGALFGRYSKRKSDTPDCPLRKKRRVPGSQISKLDPMSLFMIPDAKVEEASVPEEQDKGDKSVLPEPNNASVDRHARKGRTRVQKIDSLAFLNQLDSNPIIPSQAVPNAVQDDDKDIVMDSEPDSSLLQEKPEKQDNDKRAKRPETAYSIDIQKLKDEVDAEINEEEKAYKSIIPDRTRASKNFIDAIKKIKTEKKLLQKEQNSLINPDDIDLKDLIIIETFEPISTRKPHTIVARSHYDPEWVGRKNFKNFHKVLPKTQTGEAQVVPILNTTVKYLSLEEYKETGHHKDHEFFMQTKRRDDDKWNAQFGAQSQQRKEINNVFSDQVKLNDKRNLSLFVVSDDDNEEPSFRKFRSQQRSHSRTQQTLNRESPEQANDVDFGESDVHVHSDSGDDNDTDDDRGLRFRFTRR